MPAMRPNSSGPTPVCSPPRRRRGDDLDSRSRRRVPVPRLFRRRHVRDRRRAATPGRLATSVRLDIATCRCPTATYDLVSCPQTLEHVQGADARARPSSTGSSSPVARPGSRRPSTTPSTRCRGTSIASAGSPAALRRRRRVRGRRVLERLEGYYGTLAYSLARPHGSYPPRWRSGARRCAALAHDSQLEFSTATDVGMCTPYQVMTANRRSYGTDRSAQPVRRPGVVPSDWSGRGDLNSRPPRPERGALAKLRYCP